MRLGRRAPSGGALDASRSRSFPTASALPARRGGVCNGGVTKDDDRGAEAGVGGTMVRERREGGTMPKVSDIGGKQPRSPRPFLRRSSPGRAWVAVLGAAMAAVVVGACSGGEEEGEPSPAVAPSSVAEAEVTVTAEVTRALDVYVVELGAPAGEPLLVVIRSPNSAEVGATVEVTGPIRVFRLRELEAELRVDLDDGRLAPYEGSRALLATSVRRSRLPAQVTTSSVDQSDAAGASDDESAKGGEPGYARAPARVDRKGHPLRSPVLATRVA